MNSKSNFKDHFSSLARDYAQFRPDYPNELFQYLASVSNSHDLALDCATGSGQAALGLTPYFEKVIATDASTDQVKNAVQHPKIEYQVSPAEQIDLKDNSANLVTVAQALHWFDFDRFFREVRRVGKEDGIIAAWAYELATVTPEIDHWINHFYDDIVGPYWPEERKYIDGKYQTIPFPFEKIETPAFEIVKEWDVDHMLSYLGTWSATKNYKKSEKSDPIGIVEKPLRQLYTKNMRVSWKIMLLMGRIHS